MIYEIEFFGHGNVRSTHPRTIEITKERNLTPSGDCIIGVGAKCGCKEIPARIKDVIMDSGTKIRIEISVDESSFTVLGRGDANLTMEDPDDIVIRRSSFVCPRTLAVRCDAAADSIPREMIRALQDPFRRATFRIVTY